MNRVVIIEDDRDFAGILKEFIEEDLHDKVVAVLASESEAVEFINSTKLREIDAVLVDLQLPQSPGSSEVSSLAGLRLTREIRQHLHFAGRLLILTNSRQFADGERALAAGCDGYLCKHAPMAEIPQMLAELKIALRGDVVLVSREMRHVFLREEISLKEARLMDMLDAGQNWAAVAQELGYKNAKAAANIGYRVFDKLIGPADRESLGNDADTKRRRALERWRARGSPTARR
jgi:DNA-binding NarL/FixJ family response regulator